jgi:hypothetical protein
VGGFTNQSDTLAPLSSVPAGGTFWSAQLSMPPWPFALRGKASPTPTVPIISANLFSRAAHNVTTASVLNEAACGLSEKAGRVGGRILPVGRRRMGTPALKPRQRGNMPLLTELELFPSSNYKDFAPDGAGLSRVGFTMKACLARRCVRRGRRTRHARARALPGKVRAGAASGRQCPDLIVVVSVVCADFAAQARRYNNGRTI